MKELLPGSNLPARKKSGGGGADLVIMNFGRPGVASLARFSA
jgi:hypothetical protein